MKLEWRCKYENGSICEFLNGTYIIIPNASPILSIQKLTVPGDLNYTFTLVATKDIRKEEYSVRIELKGVMTP